jgi:urease accessory protein
MRCVPWALALIVLPSIAGAHTGDHASMSFIAGCMHPFTGLDHLLAMVGVGVIAGRATGTVRWLLPLCFLSAMAAGGALGMEAMPLSLVETVIAMSVLFTSAAVLVPLRLSPHLMAALTALFAIFHGHAHGTEMDAATSAFAYAAGMLTGAALLLAIGFALGRLRASIGSHTSSSEA